MDSCRYRSAAYATVSRHVRNAQCLSCCGTVARDLYSSTSHFSLSRCCAIPSLKPPNVSHKKCTRQEGERQPLPVAQYLVKISLLITWPFKRTSPTDSPPFL